MILSDLFVEKNAMDFSVMLLSLVVAALNGGVIYLTYGRTYDGVFHSSGLRISLFLLPPIVGMLILVVMTNLALSLGMLGALSIVRYRTPVKEPLDLLYVFWAISAGIGAGSGFFLFTTVTTLFVVALLLLVTRHGMASARTYGVGAGDSGQHLLILSFDSEENRKNGGKLINFGSIVADVDNILAGLARKHVVKSRFFESDFCELVCEADIVPENKSTLLRQIEELGGKAKLIGQN